ncbi:siderophore-interacting protein [Nakamurella sp. GG22]
MDQALIDAAVDTADDVAPRARRAPVTRSPHAVAARVRRVLPLGPHMIRITLTAPEFAAWQYLLSDHYVRMLFPLQHQDAPRLPLTDQWWPELVAMPAAERPVLRNYTVVDVRPDVAEVDIDFVRHEPAGPACEWASTAVPGANVGLIDQGVLHEIRRQATDYLIVGDESALPAAAGLLAALPDAINATVLIEVPDPRDRRDLPTSCAADIRYLIRSAPRSRPGTLLPEAVRSWRPAGARPVAWVSGESGMTTAVRRMLVLQGIPRGDISFHGYFKHGAAQYAAD